MGGSSLRAWVVLDKEDVYTSVIVYDTTIHDMICNNVSNS